MHMLCGIMISSLNSREKCLTRGTGRYIMNTESYDTFFSLICALSYGAAIVCLTSKQRNKSRNQVNL